MGILPFWETLVSPPRLGRCQAGVDPLTTASRRRLGPALTQACLGLYMAAIIIHISQWGSQDMPRITHAGNNPGFRGDCSVLGTP